jgi:hypothetical protein
MPIPFEPWNAYPSLTMERLSRIASVMRDVRNETAELHDPTGGDNSWSLGCRVYARTLARLRDEALVVKWLRILPELQALRFTFAIGNTPIKFYKGAADDVPSRSLIQSYSELRQMRLAIEFDQAPANLMVRFAVEADAFGKTASITLVEVDDEGTARRLYEIPLRGSNVITLQSKPISIAPPKVRVKKQEKEKKVAEGGDNSDGEK